MGTEEVLAACGRHRRRRADLECERGRGHELRESVDPAGPRAAHQLEPAFRIGQRGAAADRSDLDAGEADRDVEPSVDALLRDRKSTRLNSSHVSISYAVFCLKKKKITNT